MKFLTELPTEILLRILSFLAPHELCNSLLISNLFNRLGNDPSIWREHLSRIGSYNTNIGPNVNMKKMFLEYCLPIENLRKGRFVYRTLSKTFAEQTRSALRNHLPSFLHPHTAVINTTSVYNWETDLPQQVLGRSLLDIKTLKITPLKASQFKDMHVTFSCGYFIALKLYARGPVTRQLFVYETDPNDITKVSSEPISILELPRVQDAHYDAHILCNHLLMHSKVTKLEEKSLISGLTAMKVYDLKQRVTDSIADFSFHGHSIGMNENHIVIALQHVIVQDVYVLDWRKANGLVTTDNMKKFSHDGLISAAAVSGDRLLCWVDSELYLWDLNTQRLISVFNAPPADNCRITCFHGNFCFLMGAEFCAAFDLASGTVMRTLSVGQIVDVQPILNEEARPAGKYFITGLYHRGVLDLSGPQLNVKFQVLVLPAVHSAKAAADKAERVEVAHRDLSAAIQRICNVDGADIESQVLFVKKNKYRYTLIFSCKLAGLPSEMPSRIVMKLLNTSKLPPHFENCPIHAVNFEGKVNRFHLRLDNDQVPILPYLRGYGPSILLYEEWSESQGWVPTSVPSPFDLKKFIRKLK